MTSKFNYVVCSIEDSNNVSTLIVDEHQSNRSVLSKEWNGIKKMTKFLKSPMQGGQEVEEDEVISDVYYIPELKNNRYLNIDKLK